MSTSKFMIIDAFFVYVNNSSIPATVPEQFETVVPSTFFVTVAVLMCLLLVTETLLYCRPSLAVCSDQAPSQSTSKLNLVRALIHIHNRRVISAAVSRLLKENSNGRQTTYDYAVACAQSSKFILFFIQ